MSFSNSATAAAINLTGREHLAPRRSHPKSPFGSDVDEKNIRAISGNLRRGCCQVPRANDDDRWFQEPSFRRALSLERPRVDVRTFVHYFLCN